ncbi:hypothetical protein K402DRAFT_337509, partial [Aulographum hederae CBS 113979]
DQGRRVPIFHCNRVECSVIDTDSETSIRLLDDQYRGSVRARARANKTLTQHIVDIRLDYLCLVTR